MTRIDGYAHVSFRLASMSYAALIRLSLIKYIIGQCYVPNLALSDAN